MAGELFRAGQDPRRVAVPLIIIIIILTFTAVINSNSIPPFYSSSFSLPSSSQNPSPAFICIIMCSGYERDKRLMYRCKEKNSFDLYAPNGLTKIKGWDHMKFSRSTTLSEGRTHLYFTACYH